jgi:dephospho-CoA kinase
MSILVGLTGSIGSGKSLAASYFKELGAYVIHADLICRQLVAPDEPAWKEIVLKFGSEYLSSDNTLNRSKLATEIFKSKSKRKVLEAILHHRVMAEEKKLYFEQKKNNPKAVVIIDSALLIESKNYKNVDKVIVVESSQELQIKRVVSRDGETLTSVEKRLKIQMPLAEKLNYADYVLCNITDREQLKYQVHQLYLDLKNFAIM